MRRVVRTVHPVVVGADGPLAKGVKPPNHCLSDTAVAGLVAALTEHLVAQAPDHNGWVVAISLD